LPPKIASSLACFPQRPCVVQLSSLCLSDHVAGMYIKNWTRKTFQNKVDSSLEIFWMASVWYLRAVSTTQLLERMNLAEASLRTLKSFVLFIAVLYGHKPTFWRDRMRDPYVMASNSSRRRCLWHKRPRLFSNLRMRSYGSFNKLSMVSR